MLKEIISPEIKIVTVEDPVEYSMDGVNQAEVNPQIDLTTTFASVALFCDFDGRHSYR